MEEKKYPIGGYAPGNYQCHCGTCGGGFIGDKRAYQCESCADSDKEKFDALTPVEQEELLQRNARVINEVFAHGVNSNDFIESGGLWKARAIAAEKALEERGGAVWVKASSQNIKDGEYISKYPENGVLHIGITIVEGAHIHFVENESYNFRMRKGRKDLDNLLLLDESNEQPVEQGYLSFNSVISSLEYYQGVIAGLADGEDNAFSKGVHYQRIGMLHEAIETIKNYSQVLKPAPIEQKENEAVEFAEWLRTFEPLDKQNGQWVLESQVSSQQLYNEYQKQNNP